MRHIYTILLSGLIASSLVAQTPVGNYPLDGNAADISGNNYNGVISGSPAGTLNRYNQPNSAMLFNGTSDYIVLPNSFDFPTRSIVVWFYATQTGNSNLIYSNDGPSTQNGLTSILAQTSQNQNQVLIQTDQVQYASTISLNTWYQAAVVRTPTVVKMYLNGALVYSANTPNGAHSQNGTVTTGIIGADRSYSAKFFGKIDDLSIYDSALPDSAIANNYTSLKDIHELEKHVTLFIEGGNVIYEMDKEFQKEIKAIYLYNALGEVVSQSSNVSDRAILNNTDLENGLYFAAFIINNEKRVISKKILLVK